MCVPTLSSQSPYCTHKNLLVPQKKSSIDEESAFNVMNVCAWYREHRGAVAAMGERGGIHNPGSTAALIQTIDDQDLQ